MQNVLGTYDFTLYTLHSMLFVLVVLLIVLIKIYLLKILDYMVVGKAMLSMLICKPPLLLIKLHNILNPCYNIISVPFL